MKFRDIKEFVQANYRVNIGVGYLKTWLADHESEFHLEMDPEFQRGYVWTEFQQTSFVEFFLRNPTSGIDIHWNSPHWMRWKTSTWDKGNKPVLQLVDGKQRINAVLRFLNDEIPAYGCFYSQYEDKIDTMLGFVFHIADLSDPIEVVDWYLAMNTGGSIHTEKDLEPAYEYRKKLQGKQ